MSAQIVFCDFLVGSADAHEQMEAHISASACAFAARMGVGLCVCVCVCMCIAWVRLQLLLTLLLRGAQMLDLVSNREANVNHCTFVNYVVIRLVSISDCSHLVVMSL